MEKATKIPSLWSLGRSLRASAWGKKAFIFTAKWLKDRPENFSQERIHRELSFWLGKSQFPPGVSSRSQALSLGSEESFHAMVADAESELGELWMGRKGKRTMISGDWCLFKCIPSWDPCWGRSAFCSDRKRYTARWLSPKILLPRFCELKF